MLYMFAWRVFFYLQVFCGSPNNTLTYTFTIILQRLAALSVAESKATRAIGANTSQKGNGTNFRNEMKGILSKQEPIAVDGQVRVYMCVHVFNVPPTTQIAQ